MVSCWFHHGFMLVSLWFHVGSAMLSSWCRHGFTQAVTSKMAFAAIHRTQPSAFRAQPRASAFEPSALFSYSDSNRRRCPVHGEVQKEATEFGGDSYAN